MGRKSQALAPVQDMAIMRKEARERKKEIKLPSEAAASSEIVKIVKHFPNFSFPCLENCNRCHKTVSGGSL